MKLNEKEKLALINLLKKQYNENIELLDDDELHWIRGEEQRQEVTHRSQRIKEEYERLENQQGEVEILFDIEKANQKGEWIWWTAVCAIFNDFKDENTKG